MLSAKGDSCKDEVNNLITNVFYEVNIKINVLHLI